MAGEYVEGFTLPAPVLHDLRRELDEIPGDVRAREAPHRHPRQQVVHQVAELVKEGLHFAMGEKRGLASHRRRDVRAKEAQMRFRGHACQEPLHPRATPLALAREDIDVERTRHLTLVVDEAVSAHRVVPNGHVVGRLDRYAVQSLNGREEPA